MKISIWKSVLIFICMYCFHPVNSSESLSFQNALLMAEKHESIPRHKEYVKSKLLPFYELVMKNSITDCISNKNVGHNDKFTIVLKINKSNKLDVTWINNENRISKCIESKLKKTGFPSPPFYPYYSYMVWSPQSE